METTTFSYLVRSMSDSNHMGGIWSQESLDTSTCGMGTDSKDMVSEVESTDSGVPTGYRELDGVGAETISLQSERIPDSPCLVIWGLTWGLGRWVVRLGHCTQKLLPVIYIFKLLAESIVYQWGVIWQCLVLIPPPTCLCHRASYLRFPHLNRGNFLHEFFELMISREDKQFIPIS